MLKYPAIIAGVVAVLVTASDARAASYFQGFEVDDSGWFGVSRVPSGTNGITSATGNFHAEYSANSFTRWGGYDFNMGPGVPFQPYTTSIDIYLDLSIGTNDTRFDFTSAINNSAGNHLQDFAFNAGFYNDATGPGAGVDRFVISASNNTGRANSFPKNPGRDPIAILQSGWYTFQHEFFDDGGTLGVTMSIFDTLDNLLNSWSPGGGQNIGDVGGNRYGWFPNNELATLAFDNTSLESVAPVPVPAALPLFLGGLSLLGLFGWRRKRMAAA